MLKSVFELSYFTGKSPREKVNFFKISKGRYFLQSGRADIILPFFEISKCTF